MARSSKISEEVLEKIKQMIQNNLKEGDKLPPENVLCEILGASRTTIRECIAVLTSQGILVNRKGGKYVSGSPLNYCDSMFHMMLNMDVCSISDMLQVRNLLEIDVVRIVAAHPTEVLLQELDKIVWELQRPDILEEEFSATDLRFHTAMAKATNNKLLVDLIDSLREISAGTGGRTFPFQDKRELIDNRVQLLSALKTGNQAKAISLAQKHIEASRVFFGMFQPLPTTEDAHEQNT